MSTERDDPLAPPTADEEREAERLRRALDAEPTRRQAEVQAGSDEIATLTATARMVAGRDAEPLSGAVRARTLRRVLASLPQRRPSWWRRCAYAGVAVAAAASVAVVVIRGAATSESPRAPYAQVFRRPFSREGRPADRLARIIAWRRGRLDAEGSR